MNQKYLYQDPAQPIDARVEDLLQRMTLPEKVGQMCQLDGRVDPLKMVAERQPGSFLQVLGDEITPILEANERTPLRIPILFAVDAIHGHSFWPGATIFPAQLGLAASWNPELLERVAAITRVEMFHTGVSWTFSPVLCFTRDVRWGRVGETFGEDSLLIGDLAAAMVRGYQGSDLTLGVLATAKHFAGYSETQGGRDASEADLSRRKLRCYFLPPFRRAAEAGTTAFMTGYQSIEGQPSTANSWLLREVLREEWGFEGVVVTDWDNVGRMVWEQRTCPDYATAAALAIRAGNDFSMATPNFFDGALEAVSCGMVEETLIDQAVRRILRLKFILGLFEDPRRPDATRASQVIGVAAHREEALEAARQSIVLLRNDGILPLSPEAERVALIGPNADHPLAQLGDWSLGTGQANVGKLHPRESVVTIRDGFAQIFPDLAYAEGCRITAADYRTPQDGLALIPEAVEAARSAGVIVVVIGDQFAYYGECKSTATLELMGGQRQLLEALVGTGRPLVVIVQSSKPLVLPDCVLEHARAILWAGCPGILGGQAVAEVVAGLVAPSGRLTVSWPKHAGQQPSFYSQVRGQHGDRYADLDQSPLFAFGEGLTYSKIRYGELRIDRPEIKAGEALEATIELSNLGGRCVIEVVQAYVSDLITSVTWVNQTLGAYQRVELKAGETKEVPLKIPPTAMRIVDLEGNEAIEAGEFELRVGPNSRQESHKVVNFRVSDSRTAE